MARILYAVNGEGMGHAVRSKVVIEHLIKKNHKVIIVAGDRAFHFLSKHFKNVYNIECYNIVYKDNAVQNIDTTIETFRKFPSALKTNIKHLLILMIKFEPEIVITDFEPFSNFVSKIFKIPVLSIDNMSIMKKAKIKIPLREFHSFLTARVAMKSFMRINANKYIITTFFYPDVNNPKDTVLVPPVLRPEILKTKPKKGDHILVYQTSETNKKLLSVLKRIKEKFIIYGFNISKKDKNLILRKFSEKGFIKDMAACKAIIVNGGFTVLGEALHLHKPILSIPIRRQFEQILNAYYIKKLGYGEYCKTINSECIKEFIKNLGTYQKNIETYKQDGNKKLFREVDISIKALIKK